MDKKAFDLLNQIENTWWYRSRALVISRLLEKYFSQGKILDFGAGYGGMTTSLKKFGIVDAFEPSANTQTKLVSRGYEKIYITEEEIPSQNQYDLIAALDVIEHIEDDMGLLKNFHTLLSGDGMIIATVPAFQWLWSQHDVSNHHKRRYSRTQLKQVFERSGFQVQYLGFWNFFLFFPAAILRMLGMSGEGSTKSGIISSILEKIVRLECLLVPRFRLPVGLSLVIVARKK